MSRPARRRGVQLLRVPQLSHAAEGNSRRAIISWFYPRPEFFTSQRRIARELGIRQAGAAENNLIRSNRGRGEEMDRARSRDEVVLVHAVAADADRADEFSVAIERKAAREDRNSIRQIRIRRGRQRTG